ncbi:hypothetical protein cand_009000 [Cryptosporidium andersoni]|uniref:EF-hand domain-containing protein n=1 Tax=Cryptosporidium andersoni TaxID=117008 RepID=A0A1J4MT29_9CRYT|nr:hypothetical protein cand_009000 [Cryptosporidium andersoni]
MVTLSFLADDEDVDLQHALESSLIDSTCEPIGINLNDSYANFNKIEEYMKSIEGEFIDILTNGSTKSTDDLEFLKSMTSEVTLNNKNHEFLYLSPKDMTYNPSCDEELSNLSTSEVLELLNIVFGSTRPLAQAEDIRRWLLHSFELNAQKNTNICNKGESIISNNSLNMLFGKMNFCLVQQYGGPCGILSPIQGYMLKQIIFRSGTLCNARDLLNYMDNIDEETCWRVFIEALCIILYQSSLSSTYKVIQLKSNLASLWEENSMYIRKFESIIDVYQFYLKRCRKGIFSRRGSLLSFLFSVIATRGVDTIQSEVDMIDNPLIGLYGHCSQELVNLMIVGKAVSNVFDGTKVLDEDGYGTLILRGIPKRSIIGYLTEHEAFQYCTVGFHYKYPLLPIWIIGNKNHYRCSFSFSYEECILSPSEQLNQILMKSFQIYDKDNSGFIMDTQVESYLSSINMPEFHSVLKENISGGILLWSDLKTLIFDNLNIPLDDSDIRRLPCTLYVFDCQVNKGTTLICATLLDLKDYSVIHKDGNITKKKTADELDLVSILQTRWGSDAVFKTSLINLT